MINLQAAQRIIEAALAKGGEKGFAPLAVVVLDTGGSPIAYQRADGATPGRFQVAHGKAYGCVMLGMTGRALAARAGTHPHFIEGVNGAFGGAMVPVPGGVLVRDADGKLIGAVGVSGDISENDEIAAVAGIEAAGFTADP